MLLVLAHGSDVPLEAAVALRWLARRSGRAGGPG
jgi:hypothetical protein